MISIANNPRPVKADGGFLAKKHGFEREAQRAGSV